MYKKFGNFGNLVIKIGVGKDNPYTYTCVRNSILTKK